MHLRATLLLVLLVGGACAEKTSAQVTPNEVTTPPASTPEADGRDPAPAAGKPVDVAIERMEWLLESPELDSNPEENGKMRLELCVRLGQLRDPAAVPVLMRALGQDPSVQPVSVHRAVVDALGHIRDPRAVDALLSVPFRIPDAPSTSNIGQRAKLALVRIGEPAVPATLQMLRGEHSEVMMYAKQNGVSSEVVTQAAAGILGALGSASAVPALLEAMPTDACGGERKPASGDQQSTARGLFAHSLGLIGDARAVEPLCRCAMASGNPGDMFPVIESLGRIGGPSAAACLADVVRKGRYSRDIVRRDFEFEPRWEAARFAVLASAPHELSAVTKAMASNRNPSVKAKLEGWSSGIELVALCNEDRDCYLRTLVNTKADWFARETAAFAVARLSPGDVEVAEAITKAFTVREADARVSMAWLPVRMLAGKKCQGCAETLQATLDAERMALPVQFQRSILAAQNAIAQLEDPIVGAPGK